MRCEFSFSYSTNMDAQDLLHCLIKIYFVVTCSVFVWFSSVSSSVLFSLVFIGLLWRRFILVIICSDEPTVEKKCFTYGKYSRTHYHYDGRFNVVARTEIKWDKFKLSSSYALNKHALCRRDECWKPHNFNKNIFSSKRGFY